MPHTKRVPIARQPSLQITPKAIELFEAMERTGRQRNARTCVPDNTYPVNEYCRFECEACRRWHDLDAELNHELRLKPWEAWSVVPYNPHRPGSAKSKAWRASFDGPAAMARWRLLDDARKTSHAAKA
jgi:hypothetical protein